MRTGPLQVVAVVTAVLFSASLRAQELVRPTQAKDTRDLEVWGGGVAAQHSGGTDFNTDIWMAGGRFGRVLTAEHGPGWLHGNLQWSLDVIPVFVVTNLQSAHGFEVDPIVLRWNFAHRSGAVPYFEMAGGVVLTNEKVPVGDTSRLNFTPKVGFGWQIFRGEQRSIDLGLRAWHLSNAWTAPRNPSANGILITVGYHWFRRNPQFSAKRDTKGAQENAAGK